MLPGPAQAELDQAEIGSDVQGRQTGAGFVRLSSALHQKTTSSSRIPPLTKSPPARQPAFQMVSSRLNANCADRVIVLLESFWEGFGAANLV